VSSFFAADGSDEDYPCGLEGDIFKIVNIIYLDSMKAFLYYLFLKMCIPIFCGWTVGAGTLVCSSSAYEVDAQGGGEDGVSPTGW
jgi:hypothetical protein